MKVINTFYYRTLGSILIDGFQDDPELRQNMKTKTLQMEMVFSIIERYLKKAHEGERVAMGNEYEYYEGIILDLMEEYRGKVAFPNNSYFFEKDCCKKYTTWTVSHQKK